MRVNPDKLRKAQFLFPDNTKNFYKLPLEFKVYFNNYLSTVLWHDIYIFCRDIVDMLSQFMIDFYFQQILILAFYIIKENIMLFLAKRLQ